MNRPGFSLKELLFTIGIIAVFIALFLPALNLGRQGPARRAVCQNSLRQIMLAATNFQSTHQHFPSLMGVKGFNAVGSSDQVSALVDLLPFLDEGEQYNQITQGCTIRGQGFPAFPALSNTNYDPWRIKKSLLICPNAPRSDSKFAVTHYAFCVGDRARNISSSTSASRGLGGSVELSFDDITDGASNTISAGEIGARNFQNRKHRWAINQAASILESPVECYQLTDSNGDDWRFNAGVSLSSVGRGSHWADGRAGIGLFNTILPPNSPSASVGGIGADGIYSASSPHPGGVNIARFDGSVSFMDSDIDAGDSSSPTPTEEEMAAGVPSPYGVWGALGSINGGEIVDEF